MRRVRLILLGLLALFALSAVGSASASAEECPPDVLKDGKDVALCIEKVEIGSPSEHEQVTFTSSKKPETLSHLNVENGPKIACKKAENTGEFDTTNGKVKDSTLEVSDLRITFSECKVTNTAATEADCAVTEPIVVEGGTGDNLDGFFTPVGNPGKLKFEPSEETEVEPGVFRKVFTRITIKTVAGKPACAFPFTAALVVGEQECKVLNPEVEAVTKELECTDAESKLTFAGKKAEFLLTENVALSGANLGKKWALVAS